MAKPKNHCPHCGVPIPYHGVFLDPENFPPPDHEDILIKTKDGSISVGYYTEESGWGQLHWNFIPQIGSAGWIDDDRIEGWMPLPGKE